MPIPPRPIDPRSHGVADYGVGAFLLVAFPRLAGIEGTRPARQIRVVAALHAGYSAVTDYPLGLFKALPYRAHLALDAAGAVALAALPFVTGQRKRGRSQWVPNLAVAAFELAVLALTDPATTSDGSAA
ncbi:MAG TPA: hypothetical protein VF533_08875 [Solirubrobacteraceae bacterium]